MAHAPNLETAFSTFAHVHELNSRGASVYLHRSGEHWVFGYGIYEPRAEAHDQIYALVMAMAVNCVRSLTRGAAKPVEALLPFRAPNDAKLYMALLGGSVRFGQPEAGIVLPRSALDAPVHGARQAEFKRLLAGVAAQMPVPEKVWSEHVKHAIRPLILRGEPTTTNMATVLGVNVRTLARHLEREGTTFHALLESIRYSMARERLSITDLTVGDIADALDYAHQSSFTHAFGRWSGKTPRDWRSAARQT